MCHMCAMTDSLRVRRVQGSIARSYRNVRLRFALR